MLAARLQHTAAADPLAPLDSAALTRLDAVLAQRYEAAAAALDAVLRDPRYHALLDQLVDAARQPRLVAGKADRKAAKVFPRLAGRPWRDLAYGADGLDGAGELTPQAPDGQWHEVRIRAKKARYAVDAAVPVLGEEAKRLAKAIGKVQNLLGEHQDAAVAAQTWLDIAADHPDDHELAVTAGRLAERERAAIRAIRAGFPKVWAAAADPALSAWVP